MDGIVGKVSAFGPSGWQCGKSFSEVQCWNRIEAVSQMKTPWHRWMMQLESLDKFREITLGTRQLGNKIINKLNSSSDTKCWDSIDLNVYFYHSIDSGVNVNGIPERVSISIEEYGRH